MSKPLSYVRLDIARFGLEISEHRTDEQLGAWVRSLHKALVLGDATLNSYAGAMLSESANFKEKCGNAAREYWEGKRNHKGTYNQPNTRTEQNRTEQDKDSSELKTIFDDARKKYPGKKRGLEIEWKHFLAKHGKRKAEIIPLLIPGIAGYCRYLAANKTEAKYIKHFQGWITEERWTEEYPTYDFRGDTKKPSGDFSTMTEAEKREWKRVNVV